MIYASDLDRTLIYSLSAIGVPEDTPVWFRQRLLTARWYRISHSRLWLH